MLRMMIMMKHLAWTWQNKYHSGFIRFLVACTTDNDKDHDVDEELVTF